MRSIVPWFLYGSAFFALCPCAVLSQVAPGEYPTKAVTVVVSVAPGGPIDFEGRLHAGKMAEFMGQPFIVENKPGAGTSIGAGYVARAKPDGYTLLAVSGSFTIFPALYRNLPFDTIKDIAPLSLMSKRTTVLLVHPSFPARNFVQYVEYARANPGKINYGTLESGSGSHLAGNWIHSATRTKATFVPYKGAGPALLDLIAGRIDVASTALVTAAPLIKSGKVRALAIMNDERSGVLPGLLTIAEQGVPGYNYAAWFGFAAPAATPPAILSKLSAGFARVARAPDIVSTLEADGGIPVGSTAAELRQVIISETERWRKLVEEIGIKVEE